MAEFKISRLRFSWVGEWEDQTDFNKDEIVQYEGKAYVCLIPHTSNGFYSDLNDIEPKWELMMTGQTWKGPWEQFTFYSLDNIVIFGGIVYKCNTQHLSGAVLDTDADKWDTYAESKTWQSEWTSSTSYGVGDIVQYGGSSYECIISHISADSDLEGLEADYNDQLDSTQIKWKVVKDGVSWRGDYAASSNDSSQIRYKIGDLVKYGPSVYKCIEGYAPSSLQDDLSTVNLYTSFDETKWELWMPGLDFGQVWDANTVYQPGDVVLYGGYLYQSLRINNINNIPSFNAEDSTDDWELVSQAFDVSGDWDSSTYYKVGSVVRYAGDVYVSIVDSTNVVPGNFFIQAIYEADGSSGVTIKLDTGDSTNPLAITTGMTVTGEGLTYGQEVVSVSEENGITTVVLNQAPTGTIADGAVLTFSGTNAAYWELLIPGFEWEGEWESGVLYNNDDVVYYGNATYQCIREHTSALVSRPDLDLQHNYWIIYLQHDQRNALKQKGQMIIYRDGKISALDIGAEAKLLKAVDSLPSWGDINFTPDVFYVAVNGLDAPDRGITWDVPWRTVKYACEQVAKGTRKQNEKALLVANKEWIVEETYYWFLYQQNQNIAPFEDSVNFDEFSTKRDMRYIIDGVITDLSRGQNSETVVNVQSYFDLQSTNKYTNQTVADQALYFSAVIGQLFNNMEYAVTNTAPPQSYQVLEGVTSPLTQYFNSNLTIEGDTITILGALEGILRVPLEDGGTRFIPPGGLGGYTTINLKSGTYEEQLPIVVPARTALNGDELRGAVVSPANPINTLCTRTFGDINQFIVGSTVNMHHNTPVQFVSLNPVDEISTMIGGDNIVQGITYYVIGSSITPTTFQVAAEPDGPPVPLFTNIGYMYVYGGNALSDMFYVQNATGIRNMTLSGLLGTLSPQNEYETRRPTGGAYVSLDPGTGPDDTSAWITTRSPYIQNVTTFGLGCVGGKIDSTLHNGGNRSMTSNDFTQIISDGIGIWCKGGDALTECVSVFSYYNYAGYFAEDGGKIRATNGNSSYGKFGVVAEGYDVNEIPAIGAVNNRNNQANASAVSALGVDAEILKTQFTHSGEEYYQPTTNMLKYSNNLLNNENNWVTDGNLNIVKAPSTPFENQDAWKVEAITNLTNSAYFYQDVAVAPQGRTYTNIAGENITGSGVDATFDITVYSDRYIVGVNNGGSGYVVGNQIRISGQEFGGPPDTNDIVITVETLSITSILEISHVGTVPAGSALPYTASVYAKKSTAQYFDLYTIFSGFETRTSGVRFNFDNETLSTLTSDDFGIVPSSFSADYVEDDWWRISFTFWDETAQNTALRYKVYPRGIDGLAGSTLFYGTQLQIDSLTFFLETQDKVLTSYANVHVSGAGVGAQIVANELRSGSVFQTRILENPDTLNSGGKNYKLQTNNAQAGTDEYLTLAGSEVATPAEYEGMRLVVASGRGAGQYGIISRYDDVSKQASVLKESFEALEIISADAATDRFRVSDSADFHTTYVGQKLQFTPTFFDITVSSTAQNSTQVLATLGDLNNYMYVTSTARLRTGQKINFTGTTFGGVITGFDYYIIGIIDDQTIQISTTLAGGVWPLSNVNIEDPQGAPIVFTTDEAPFTLNYPANTSYLFGSDTTDMQIGYPIQFTGTSLGEVVLGDTYYIHDIYDANNFSISANIETLTATSTQSSNNSITIDDTSVLIPLNAVIFSRPTFGGIQEKTQYWVKNIIDGTDFSIASALLTRTATATTAVSNLITVDSTAGFTTGSPIVFTGTTFGGLDNDKVYYIQVVNDATSFTISETPAGAAVPLLSSTGQVIVRTTANTVSLTDATGTMIGKTPGAKEEVSSSGGAVMEASFYTETFGGVSQGTTYYLLEKFEDIPKDSFNVTGNWVTINNNTKWDTSLFAVELDASPDPDFLTYLQNLQEGDTLYVTDAVYGNLEIVIGAGGWLPDAPAAGSISSIATQNVSPFSGGVGGNPYNGNMTDMAFPTGDPAPKEFTIATTAGGTVPVALTSDTGSMQIGEVGWDHINAGTPLVNSFDSTSVYQIEPRLKFDAPPAVQTAMQDLPYMVFSTSYPIIRSNGDHPIAFPKVGYRAISTSDYDNWDIDITLPVDADDRPEIDFGPGGTQPNPNFNGGWVDACFGNHTWILMSGTGQILRSVSEGVTWLTENLTDLIAADETPWSAIAYGDSTFVAVARGSSISAYSNDNGATWTEVDETIGDDDWVDIAYGKGTFVAISGSSDTVKYSTDKGITWNEASLSNFGDSTVNNWTQIQYGNGRFVAVSSTLRSSVYSFDGITWYTSNLEVSGTILTYGQGIFVLVEPTTGVCCQSPDGYSWKLLDTIGSNYTAMGFTFDNTTNKGWFLSTTSTGNSYKLSTGTRALARASITDGIITSIGMLESGSGYTTSPALKITDPNNSEEAVTQIRVGNGSLGAPTFYSFGRGYNTTSTAISINGSGYSDAFQTGLNIVCKDLTRVPQPGDNVQFEGNPEIYRVARATILRGTTVPNLECNIRISPQLTEATSPEHDTPLTIRSRFSQVRLTNHDYLNIGFGNKIQSNYPGLPEETSLQPQDEVQETNNGRVFYSSTDQDGNFRVGDLFAVEQATGIVTLSADDFGLAGLTELSIGGVALGGSPVVIRAFSTDGTFVANSNSLVPTQRAIRTYLTSRLSQGGSDTFTGLLTAGTVKVGGPDIITSTIQEGSLGWQVQIPVKAMFDGTYGNSGWAGDGLAMAYFMKTFVDPTRSGQQ